MLNTSQRNELSKVKPTWLFSHLTHLAIYIDQSLEKPHVLGALWGEVLQEGVFAICVWVFLIFLGGDSLALYKIDQFDTSLFVLGLVIVSNTAEWNHFEMIINICSGHFEKFDYCCVFWGELLLHAFVVKDSMLEKIFFEKVRTVIIDSKYRTSHFISQWQICFALKFILNRHPDKNFKYWPWLSAPIDAFHCRQEGASLA